MKLIFLPQFIEWLKKLFHKHEWVFGRINGRVRGTDKILTQFDTRMCPKCGKYQYLTQRPVDCPDEWFDIEHSKKDIVLDIY